MMGDKMAKIEKIEYDENRFKMHTADVIKEMIAKTNEIIDVVSKDEKRGKGKEKRVER